MNPRCFEFSDDYRVFTWNLISLSKKIFFVLIAWSSQRRFSEFFQISQICGRWRCDIGHVGIYVCCGTHQRRHSDSYFTEACTLVARTRGLILCCFLVCCLCFLFVAASVCVVCVLFLCCLCVFVCACAYSLFLRACGCGCLLMRIVCYDRLCTCVSCLLAVTEFVDRH